MKQYLVHLETLAFRKGQRKQTTQSKTEELSKKENTDYDWKEVFHENKLKDLNVSELNKYITHHRLAQKCKNKSAKVKCVQAHIARGIHVFEETEEDQEKEAHYQG